ncbi:shikimate 5-dehydrogenase [Altererythrobacter sp. B11]|uniref:shikimate 5-dehydrogenase n=1 Tax=Altererythrobacter sp. B11 TaxID=2060312 RepID=UPI000E5B0CE0|nr:shikimate 5-dehydrogenase [Altererythrobacter sp. B11]
MADRRLRTKPPIGPDTKLCISLSGRPGRSGTLLHNRLYETTGLDFVYKSFGTQDLAGAVAGIRALGIRGCGVSMPFKEAVIPMLDALEGSARAIDSVNTIVNDDGVLTGYNTDFIAVRDLLAADGIDPATPFVLRGSGGMAKAVAAALHDLGFANGIILARNRGTGPALAQSYGYAWSEDLPDTGAPLLINVTPVGMAGGNAGELAFPKAWIAASDLAFDVVAQPAETPFILTARDAGKRVISGASVIVLQAVEQFALYTSIRPAAHEIVEAAAFAHGDAVATQVRNVLAMGANRPAGKEL